MKPLIGITACEMRDGGRDWRYNTSDYFRAIQFAGGVPVLLPFCDTTEEAGEILAHLDGLLLSGGDDVDPQLYGEQPHQHNGDISPARDTTELALVKVALERNMPILGVCRGHQVMAVAAGGALWQDIPAQVPGAIKHSQSAAKSYPTHAVAVKAGTRLADLLGTSIRVNSRHHQAVKSVPSDWVISAQAPDGIVEAMEHPGHRFALSVQWHPENFTHEAYNHNALFKAFIAAASR
ncbi:MAG: gamma-glutamyl-gamma-aminobutyrate hydrolase family protein [Mycobacterium leprae]